MVGWLVAPRPRLCLPFLSARDLGSNVSVWATTPTPTGHVCAAAGHSQQQPGPPGSSLRPRGRCGPICGRAAHRWRRVSVGWIPWCVFGPRARGPGVVAADRGRGTTRRPRGGVGAGRSDSRGGRFAIARAGGVGPTPASGGRRFRRGAPTVCSAVSLRLLSLSCFFFSFFFWSGWNCAAAGCWVCVVLDDCPEFGVWPFLRSRSVVAVGKTIFGRSGRCEVRSDER